MTKEESQHLSHSNHHPARQDHQFPEEGTSPAGEMETTPRNWVMHSLSPALEQTDLRNLLASSREKAGQETTWVYNNEQKENGSLTLVFPQHSVTVTSQPSDSNHDVLVRNYQVQVSEGGTGTERDASNPSSPGSTSSTESQKGFYSFVDEESNTEAEKNEAWMTSPERQAKLATLKEANGFKLQAYMEERKPEKLFQDGNDDSCYQVKDVQVAKQDERKQMQERLEIIRSQAPKRNHTFTTSWTTHESLDVSNSSQMQEELSLCYSPLGIEKSPVEAEPGTVDTERINFSAARQQFLKMEQNKSNPFLQSSHELPPSKIQGNPFLDGSMAELRKGTCDCPSGKQLNMSQSFDLDPVRKDVPGSKRVNVFTSEEEANMNQSCLSEHLNHGPQHSLGDESISHSDDSSEVFGQEETASRSLSLSETETPIEREIRLTQEREESLRRERGIKWFDTKEMVEIKTKSLLSPTRPSAMAVKAKERNRVSFFIQREIQMENQREADLQHQGKVQGLYDRGTPQELEERKRVFEMQTDLVPIIKMSLTGTEADVAQAKTGAEGGFGTSQPTALVEKGSETENISSPCSPHPHTDEKTQQLFGTGSFLANVSTKEKNPHTPPSPSLLTPVDNTSVTDDARNRDTTSQTTSMVRTANPDAENLSRGPSLEVENKGSPSAGVIPSAKYTPPSKPTSLTLQTSRPTLQWTGHNERFNLRPRKVHTPEAIRREIEQDLMREEELRKLREASVISTSQESDQDVFCTGDTEQETPNVWVLKEQAAKKEAHVTVVTLEEQTGKLGSSLSSLGFDTFNHHESAPTTSKAPEKLAVSTTPVQSPRLVPGFSSASIVTAQPWSAQRLTSPTATCFTPLKAQTAKSPAPKGLTESLLGDYEERCIRMKMEAGAYAGIQPTDNVNNEVLEATRVTRHKNTRALKWEAGVFANTADD